MNEDFQTKIDKLKTRTYANDSYEIIGSWEKEMAVLKATSEWMQHPITIKLTKICIERIRNIKAKLASDRTLSEVERKMLFAEEDAHLCYLVSLTEDPESQIKVIEKRVNDEL